MRRGVERLRNPLPPEGEVPVEATELHERVLLEAKSCHQTGCDEFAPKF
jgi:hypothetical protein